MFITLTLLTMIPLSTGYIDCRISCRRCHEHTEHPSVLEVYCAMCEECKQRRRERMLSRTPSRRMTTTIATSLVRMRDGVGNSAEQRGKSLLMTGSKIAPAQSITEQGSPQALNSVLSPQAPQAQHAPKPAQRLAYRVENERMYPAGCPTPPMCADSDEAVILVHETTPFNPPTTTTSTTTTTQPTPPPCPPVQSCRKKKPMMSCMPCMPMCPCPMYNYPQPQQQIMLTQPTTPASSQADYHYLYLGLPKNMLKLN
uniref:Uncharacterized protein n=1 Tax=Heliothis virescens TaxID=7102 RepID=A0A2A4J5Q6_HELVI